MSEGTAVSFRTINQPLVPVGCTTLGLEYMPLHDERLRKSRAWLRARRNPAHGFYLMNLWTAAWKGTPAGSLEDDDDVLADAAMCDPAKWDEVKAEVMRGWLRCKTDGRLYHPFVCAVAKEVWETRVAYRDRTATARAAKAAKRARQQQTLDLAAENSPAAENETPPNPAEKAEVVAEPASVTDLKCESLRSNQGESPPYPLSLRLDPFWEGAAEQQDLAARLGLDYGDALERFRAKFLGTRARSDNWPARFQHFIFGMAEKPRSPGKLDYMTAYTRGRMIEVFGEQRAA